MYILTLLNAQQFLMILFAIFGLASVLDSASVEIRPLPGAWVAELLGVSHSRGPQLIKDEIFHVHYNGNCIKGLRLS